MNPVALPTHVTDPKNKVVVMNSWMKNVLAFVVPILLAWLLSLFFGAAPEPQESMVEPPLALRTVDVQSADELEAVFAELDYSWPVMPEQAVPALSVVRIPKDLAELRDVKRKKALFFQALLPLVIAENQGVMEARQMVLGIVAKGPETWTEHERKWLSSIAQFYHVRGNVADVKVQQRILRRIDIIPPELALAQAANESAWGTSRFAQLANNLFGQWTYKESEGLVPLDRPEGAKYAVRKFDTLDASVRAYLQNLNTHAAYLELRLKREQMRKAGGLLDASEMAAGLHHYSARGEHYIEEIRAMIRVNGLKPFMQTLELRSAEPLLDEKSSPVPVETSLLGSLRGYFTSQG